jgi:hypothetical protein
MASGNHHIQVTVSDQVGKRQEFMQYEMFCPNDCYKSTGNGDCQSNGICKCNINQAYGQPYEGRDCSLGYCGSSNKAVQLKGATGFFSDHTEMTPFYKPWSQAGSKCTWQIIPDQGSFIKLEFDKFDLQPGVDFVNVFAKTQLLATISGTTIPAPIETSAGELTVTYTSASSNRTGFAAKYTTSKCPMDCMASVGQGTCDQNTGKCTCAPGWRGDGCMVGYPVLDLDLKDIADGDSLLELRGASLSFGCTSPDKQAIVFDRKGARYMTTNVLNLAEGGLLTFAIKVGSGTQGCKVPSATDSSSRRRQNAGSNVEIQYQIDGTTTWVTLQSIGPTPYQTLEVTTLKLPDSVKAEKVRIRFIQPAGGASRDADSWALGSLKVETPFICPKGNNGKECSGNGRCHGTGVCLCNRMFFGKTCDQACFINYWHEEVCGCPVPTDPYSSS